ncbi:2-dehydropantoate 2-reductase (Ketopantoate reductase) (KPA reductase) (KPR) [Rhizina undulata]
MRFPPPVRLARTLPHIESARASPRLMSTWWPPYNTMSEYGNPSYQYPLPPTPEIHIIGIGNIGNLIAHSLRTLPSPPPTTLLFHTRQRETDFHEAQSSITLHRQTHRHERYDSVATGFNYSLINFPPPTTSDDYKISNLIVVTKAHQTLSALRPLKERLSRDSTILLVQNGMGVVEELNSQLFVDPETRPNMVLGITTHGVYPHAPFSIIQRGLGNLQLGFLPTSPELISSEPPPLWQLPPTTSYLLNTLLAADLAATHLPHSSLVAAQSEKLAINAIINPLTTLFDCRNGELLNNFHVVRTARILLWEISHVLCALPELETLPGKEQRFSADRLYDVVISLARATGGNWSSMVQDVRAGKQTEIDYINGYIVERAKEFGLPCTANHMMVSMVKAKQKMVQLRVDEQLPFEY